MFIFTPRVSFYHLIYVSPFYRWWFSNTLTLLTYRSSRTLLSVTLTCLLHLSMTRFLPPSTFETVLMLCDRGSLRTLSLITMSTPH